MKYKPQSTFELVKNVNRIKGLILKCNGDRDEEIRRTKLMALTIGIPEKAYNRAILAEEIGCKHISEILMARYSELTKNL